MKIPCIGPSLSSSSLSSSSISTCEAFLFLLPRKKIFNIVQETINKDIYSLNYCLNYLMYHSLPFSIFLVDAPIICVYNSFSRCKIWPGGKSSHQGQFSNSQTVSECIGGGYIQQSELDKTSHCLAFGGTLPIKLFSFK